MPSGPVVGPKVGSQLGWQLEAEASTSLPARAVLPGAGGATEALATKVMEPAAACAKAVTWIGLACAGTSSPSSNDPSAALSACPTALVTTTAPAAGSPFGRNTRPVKTAAAVVALERSAPAQPAFGHAAPTSLLPS